MAEERRTRFGEIVYRYRTRLNLTQRELAVLASNPRHPMPEQATVSLRTVTAIEKFIEPGKTRRASRPSTVRALAAAFRLEPGSAAYEEFLEAARDDDPARDQPGPAPVPSAPAIDDRPVDPPFVAAGRHLHLERLRKAIFDAVHGQPGVVFVGANPGTGKTWLLAQACREALAAWPDLVVLWGDSMGRSGTADPHQPFRQILGVLAGNTAAAGPHQLLSATNVQRIHDRANVAATAIASVGAGLIDRLVQPETVRTLAGSGRLDESTQIGLTSLLEAAPGSRGNALGLNEQVYRTLAAYTSAGPTILVLEDLHWADVGTASMLFHLMRRLHDQHFPLLLLGSYRPAHLESSRPGDRSPVAQPLREAPRLFADPILDLSTAVGGMEGRAFVNALVDETMAGAPSELRDHLFSQTAGLPLFVAIMLRWYRANGIDTPIPDGDPGQDGTADLLPPEIRTFFADLVNRLPADLQALLNAASVQGTSFSADIVMQVLGLSRPMLIDMLDAQLTTRFGVLEAAGVTTVAGRRSYEYQFLHALLRDYLYNRMTAIERAHYHASTAEAMRDLYGDGEHEGARRIASQFDQAGERQRAARAYLRAGDYAMNFQEYEIARDLFRRIGELGLREEDPFSVAQAMIGLGNCARGLGRTAEASRLFRRAHEVAVREGIRLVEANSLTSLGLLDFDAGRMTEGAKRFGEAIDVLIEQDELAEASRALTLLSHTLQSEGDYDEAITLARHAMRLADDQRNDMLYVGGLIALTNCWLDLGLYPEAIAGFEQGIVICEEYGNLHRAAICWLNISLCAIEQGNWDQSSAALESVLEMGNRINGRLVAAASFYAGLTAEAEGNVEAAARHYQESLDLRIEHDQQALVVDSLAGMLRIATARGNRERMESLASDLATRLDSQGIEGVELIGRLYVTLVEAWQALEDLDCARDYARQGVTFISARAIRLADPAHKSSYLTAVPAHRRLFALARELGIPA